MKLRAIVAQLCRGSPERTIPGAPLICCAGQVIEPDPRYCRPTSSAPDRPVDLVAPCSLKSWAIVFSFQHSFGPAPLGAAEAFLELLLEPPELEVVLREVVDRAVLLGLGCGRIEGPD